MADGSDARLLVRMEADITKFEEGLARAQKKADEAAHNIKKKFEERNGHGGLFGNPLEALNGTFDRSRLAVLEEGSAKIPLFGSALEALGPAGLTAAAGVAAAAFAMEQAEKAADWAKNIDDGAKKVGVSTTRLQEYRLMIKEVGGAAQDADTALLTFNQRVGEAASGLTGARSMRPFAALGFTQEELKRVKDGSDLIPEIAERISHLGSAAQQAAVADKLGLTPMLPLLKQGSDKIREMSAEFQKLGLVMDDDMVRRGAEAAREFEKLSDAISVQLKEAFVDLAPVLVDTLKLILPIVEKLRDVIEHFKEIDKRSDGALTDRLGSLMEQRAKYATWLDNDAGNKRLRQTASDTSLPDFMRRGAQHQLDVFQKTLDAYDKSILDIRDQLDNRQEARAKEDHKPTGGGASLTDQTVHHAKTDPTGELDAKAAETYDAQLKRLADAQKALATNLLARAALEKTAVDADTAKTIAGIDAEIKAIKKTQLDTHKRQQIAELTSARAEAQHAAIDQKLLIDRQSADAAARTQLQLDNVARTTQQAALDLARNTAVTRQRRIQIETDLLDLAQAQQRAEAEGVLHAKTATDAEKKIAQKKLDQLDQARMIARAQIAMSNLSPGQAYVRHLTENGDEVGQKAMVTAIEDLNSGLTRALSNTRYLSRAFREMADQIVQDLLRIAIEQAVTRPLAQSLFGGPGMAAGASSGPGLLQTGFAWMSHLLGFAGGGDPPVGRPSVVGEKGPELFVPKTAGTVLPNSILRAIGMAQQAASAARTPTPIHFHQTIDLTGANGEETIARIARQKAMEGAQMAIEHMNAALPDRLVAAQTYSL